MGIFFVVSDGSGLSGPVLNSAAEGVRGARSHNSNEVRQRHRIGPGFNEASEERPLRQEFGDHFHGEQQQHGGPEPAV